MEAWHGMAWDPLIHWSTSGVSSVDFARREAYPGGRLREAHLRTSGQGFGVVLHHALEYGGLFEGRSRCIYTFGIDELGHDTRRVHKYLTIRLILITNWLMFPGYADIACSNRHSKRSTSISNVTLNMHMHQIAYIENEWLNLQERRSPGAGDLADCTPH